VSEEVAVLLENVELFLWFLFVLSPKSAWSSTIAGLGH
jgi:hypothetical protein